MVGSLLVVYLALTAILFVLQRELLFPGAGQVRNALAIASREGIGMSMRSGSRNYLGWYLPPKPGRPLILVFHGNGDTVIGSIPRFKSLNATGDGVFAVEYPGYPGSNGRPSESALLESGEFAYDQARHLLGFSDGQIALLGESLGSGVAVAVAARHRVGALVLNSPYSSVADVAADHYPAFPVRWLILDRFDSRSRIADVRSPLLVVHGDADRVIPVRFARTLFAAASEPKTLVILPGVGHYAMDADLPGTLAWIDRTLGVH